MEDDDGNPVRPAVRDFLTALQDPPLLRAVGLALDPAGDDATLTDEEMSAILTQFRRVDFRCDGVLLICRLPNTRVGNNFRHELATCVCQQPSLERMHLHGEFFAGTEGKLFSAKLFRGVRACVINDGLDDEVCKNIADPLGMTQRH